MIVIDLPRLVGSRESANSLVARTGAQLKGERVVVNCRELRSATGSFVDQLVKVVFEEHQAAEMVVLAASPEFLEQVHRAATAHGVDELITERPAGSEVGA